jgi:hypothetical protein
MVYEYLITPTTRKHNLTNLISRICLCNPLPNRFATGYYTFYIGAVPIRRDRRELNSPLREERLILS